MNPTLLIPIYQHKDEIGGVVDALRPAGLPCLIVNDGSNAATGEVLRELAERNAWLTLAHRERNGGRGAALKTGYRLAWERGFSHVLQLDADGQHAAGDVPLFLECMRNAPEALVLGSPQFDSSAPFSRLHGRKLSRVMVWLATRSTAVADPLCGFRGIPLASTLALLERIPTGDHMEFDPELVILLCRAGLEVRNIPTRVVYRSGGLSHFDTLRDNARMTSMYARALLGLQRRRGALPASRLAPR